jgi:hypothetical protein
MFVSRWNARGMQIVGRIATQFKSFFTWGRASVIGHVVVFELCFSMPIGLLGLLLNYHDGTLTLAWGTWVLFVAAGAGALRHIYLVRRNAAAH